MGTTMTMADAYLVHPIALHDARYILDGELDMLNRGIGKGKRREWLIAQRDQLLSDAALSVPAHLVPMIDALSTSDTISFLAIVQRNLETMCIGSTFRHLRNAKRRLGLPDDVLDTLSVNGALLLLINDDEVKASLRRLYTPLLDHLSSSGVFQDSATQYEDIMQQTALETEKQRKAIDLALSVLPEVLASMPDFDDAFVRDFVYIRGRILDEDIMPCLSAIIHELGAGVLDQMKADIVSNNLVTYRHVLGHLIGRRIDELAGTGTTVSRPDVTPITTAPIAQESSLSLPPLADNELLLSIAETAAMLNVVPLTVTRLIKNGSIMGTHVGRRHMVVRQSVLDYLDIGSVDR